MAKDFSKAFYNSLQWKKIRAFVLTRDFYMCKICGAPHAKIVHHIRELTPMNIGDASISMNTDNLITVCEQCHDEIHSRNHRQEARLMRAGRRGASTRRVSGHSSKCIEES